MVGNRRYAKQIYMPSTVPELVQILMLLFRCLVGELFPLSVLSVVQNIWTGLLALLLWHICGQEEAILQLSKFSTKPERAKG